MATDKSDNPTSDSNSGKKSADGMSMKERLLAQRKAAEGPAKPASAPPVPAARPAARPAVVSTPPPVVAKSAAAAAPEPPVKKPVKLSGAREEGRSGSKKPVSEDVRREIEMLRKSQDKWITYGWMVAVALLLIAGVTYFITSGKKRASDEAERVRVEKIDTWIERIKKLDPLKPADQEELEKMIADPANEPSWKSNTHGVHDLTVKTQSKFRQVKEDQKTKIELVQGIDELEKIAKEAASKSSEDLAKARRRLTQYEGQAGELGVEQTQRVVAAGDLIDRAYIAKLHEEAKALAAKGPAETKNALAAYTKAEDEVIKLLDDSVKKKIEDRKTYYMGHYREMITESDTLVTAAFTPDVIEKTPWVDLLASPQKEAWLQAGFGGWQIKDGTLQAFTELGSKGTAVMSIGDREQWRDYVLEMEFAVTKGDPVLHARLGRNPNNTTINYTIGTSGQNAFKPGATNTITVTVIGSSSKITFSDTDHTAGEETLSAFMARKGGIGISVPAGAEIKVMKMRIKPLR